MSDISQVYLIHWCVVWQKLDTKTRKGQTRVSSPVEIRCRWLPSDQANVSQPQTTEFYPRSVPVGSEVVLGSYVWGPGKIDELPSDPTYFEVVGVSKTPDLKGRHPVYRITLQKASKTLPEVV